MATRNCIEIHAFLEGMGSEYLGDWIVEIDWGAENQFKFGVQPVSIKVVKQVYDARVKE